MSNYVMLTCVEVRFGSLEARFGGLHATHPVQWLADNGSAFTAAETLSFAAAPNLVPCFTPVRSPESNGVSEAFFKTLKRDYARVQPRPDADTVPGRLGAWITDYIVGRPRVTRFGGRRVRRGRALDRAHDTVGGIVDAHGGLTGYGRAGAG